jgi:hypothetical protein
MEKKNGEDNRTLNFMQFRDNENGNRSRRLYLFRNPILPIFVDHFRYKAWPSRVVMSDKEVLQVSNTES